MAPSGFTAIPAAGQVSLRWNAVSGSGITCQLLCGSTQVGGSLTTTSYTDIGLNRGHGLQLQPEGLQRGGLFGDGSDAVSNYAVGIGGYFERQWS